MCCVHLSSPPISPLPIVSPPPSHALRQDAIHQPNCTCEVLINFSICVKPDFKGQLGLWPTRKPSVSLLIRWKTKKVSYMDYWRYIHALHNSENASPPLFGAPRHRQVTWAPNLLFHLSVPTEPRPCLCMGEEPKALFLVPCFHFPL